MTALARRPRKLTIPEFLRFYETRPDEERWQLVDGVALMMTPPFSAHQRIASNLEALLNNAFRSGGLPFTAFQRIGTELAEFPHYRPEPDVTVVDANLPDNQRYFDRFYLTAEVLSSSDDERIDLKRDFYRAHAQNRAILLVSQERVAMELDRRDGGSWRTEELSGPDAVLSLPDFGLTCVLADLYRDTSLVRPA